jgi:hypothetical protein
MSASALTLHARFGATKQLEKSNFGDFGNFGIFGNCSVGTLS